MDQLRGFVREAVVRFGSMLRPATRSVRENSGLAVLSVVLAFGLWIFVTDAENPEQTRRLPVDIPVSPVNVPSDIWVPEEVGTVRVEVRVEENVLDSLTREDFQATVDLDSLAVGEYEGLPVKVRELTGRGNLRIVDILPDKIDVKLYQLLSKRVPVDVETRGSVSSDFSLGPTEPEFNEAVVAGPQGEVETVTRVVASVDVEGRTEAFESAVRLEPRNQLGHLVQNVTVDPAFVDVSIEIEQRSFSRALAVSPQLHGTPRQGYNVVGISVEPAVVTVFGPQGFIEEAVSVVSQPVDIDDATGDVIRTVSLDLPTGASVRGGANVTVTVKISPAPGQLMFVVPVTVTGLGDDVSISGSLPAIQVFLFGPLPALLELSPNDIRATVDLGGKDAGTHRVEVKVTAPTSLEVRSISPQEIEIILEPG